MKPILGRIARWIGFALLAIAILLIGVWCSVAIWYRCPAGEPVRDVLVGVTLVFALVTVAFLATPRRRLVFAVYAASFALFLTWWATIKPTNDRNWAPDVARTVTATIDGDRLLVKNVRNFIWRSDTDFDQRWEQRTYGLSHLTNVDLIMSYWAGEAIAHTIVSFGFDDGARLAFSMETRKESHEGYSSVAGFFKQYELAVVAADERDVVRVRSNVRGEDVRTYRLRMTPENARVLLREYVEEANSLARAPHFYNTLTANCTNLVFDMVRVIHPGVRMASASSSPVISPITPTISAPPIGACPPRNFATSPRFTTRRRWPMPMPTSQREFERESRYLIDAAEALVISPIPLSGYFALRHF